MKKVVLTLGGLTCPSCLTKIKKSVEAVNGTGDIRVLFNSGKVKFTLAQGGGTVEEIRSNIEKMGYQVEGTREKEI